MAKILKIAATIGAVALAIPSGGSSLLAVGLGISSFAAGALVLGLSVGASLLSPRPKTTNSKENIDRLRASIEPNAPRKTVFGVSAMGIEVR